MKEGGCKVEEEEEEKEEEKEGEGALGRGTRPLFQELRADKEVGGECPSGLAQDQCPSCLA